MASTKIDELQDQIDRLTTIVQKPQEALEKLTTTVQELQDRVDKLTKSVGQLALLSNIDNTLSNALFSISDQLRPLRELEGLRDLTTQRRRVEPELAARLENLREALERPNWTDAGSLTVREDPVRFIGGNYVPSPQPAIQGPGYMAAPIFGSTMDLGSTRSGSDAP
ncbi:hypothetical protein [Bradyrhizobium sp. CCGE-LA001]|uniref:hypothetical protein n=1 Tax=Bradyrhizobium sp. CCGE-LA001 TaxID=1223566 RepID=UPI0002AA7FB4|nr:hypothetical protein [Bradyrhizobium sp. CCGE-LA001]AMA59930.1 hypothetical protein BCCGELA001_29230 [Bradyrhizobium sp. CCGE-LA001]